MCGNNPIPQRPQIFIVDTQFADLLSSSIAGELSIPRCDGDTCLGGKVESDQGNSLARVAECLRPSDAPATLTKLRAKEVHARLHRHRSEENTRALCWGSPHRSTASSGSGYLVNVLRSVANCAERLTSGPHGSPEQEDILYQEPSAVVRDRQRIPFREVPQTRSA
jgi:hypothetical protein